MAKRISGEKQYFLVTDIYHECHVFEDADDVTAAIENGDIEIDGDYPVIICEQVGTKQIVKKYALED